MEIGNLVRVKRSDSDIRNRNSGIIIKFDTCYSTSSRDKINITEVLWQCGPSWIDTGRIEVLKNESR
jgi:hypothetical protein